MASSKPVSKPPPSLFAKALSAANGTHERKKPPEQPVAGPSTPEKSTTAPSSFQTGDAFIPFGPDSDPESEEEPAEDPSPKRDSSKRKGKGRDHDDTYANKKQRTDAGSRKAPWITNVDWESCNNVAEFLNREVEAFVKYMSPSPVEDETRGLIVQLISKAVKQQFPDATVHAFGSYETKLYLPLGDIDLVIQSDQMAYSDKVTVLHALANTVRRAGITDRVTIIAKAKVPIVKFVTTHGRFAVDISLNQVNGVAAGQLITRYLTELPALRALVLVTKAFLSQRSMNEVYTGGLGSYSIVCLAISFLQMHPKVRRGEIEPERNLGVLVMEFFELYGCYFNYEEVGISLRDGGTYFNKAARGWQDFRQAGLLSIEDPADPSNDISRGSFGIARVRQTLAGAHSIMTSAAFQQAGVISARREGRYHQFRAVQREAPSILAHVMGITQETINHRQLVQEVYDNRTLHRMVGVAPVAESKSGRARDAVEEAWRDDEPAREDTKDGRRKQKRQRQPTTASEAKAELDSPEESRYSVARPPPKRRRTDERERFVFTTDDEPSAGSGEDSEEDGEIDEYDVDDSDGGGDNAAAKRDKTKRTRDYWLSKGIGPGDDSD